MPQSIGFRLPATHLDVAFDGPQFTSDGDLCSVAEADAVLRICAALAAQISEWRRRPRRHSIETLIRQRVVQIA